MPPGVVAAHGIPGCTVSPVARYSRLHLQVLVVGEVRGLQHDLLEQLEQLVRKVGRHEGLDGRRHLLRVLRLGERRADYLVDQRLAVETHSGNPTAPLPFARDGETAAPHGIPCGSGTAVRCGVWADRGALAVPATLMLHAACCMPSWRAVVIRDVALTLWCSLSGTSTRDHRLRSCRSTRYRACTRDQRKRVRVFGINSRCFRTLGARRHLSRLRVE
jgi:hypothetical protein